MPTEKKVEFNGQKRNNAIGRRMIVEMPGKI
jgi:hypothetical protein